MVTVGSDSVWLANCTLPGTIACMNEFIPMYCLYSKYSFYLLMSLVLLWKPILKLLLLLKLLAFLLSISLRGKQSQAGAITAIGELRNIGGELVQT